MSWSADAPPWHAAAWQAVDAAREADRLPHALLLAGPPGLGKHLFGMRVARALLCDDPPAYRDACRECVSCRRFAAGSHADFTYVRLLLKGEYLGGRKLDRDATAIRVDQVRELTASLSLSARAGGTKVALIDPADRMNTEAANALLKTLEEPTRETLIMLVAARPWRLPATVRSRCQTLNFALPDSDQALAWLASAHGIDTALGRELLAAADGRPLEALAMAGTETVAERRLAFEAFSKVLGGAADPVVVAAEWQRLDLPRLYGWLAAWLTDMIRLRCAGDGAVTENIDLRGRLQELSQRIDLNRQFDWLERVQQDRRLFDTQVNPQLLCEDLLLAWSEDLMTGRRPGT